MVSGGSLLHLPAAAFSSVLIAARTIACLQSGNEEVTATKCG